MRLFATFLVMLATIMRTGRSFRFLVSSSRLTTPITRGLVSHLSSPAFVSTASTIYRPRLLRSQAMRMSSNPASGGVDNPMNPNTYTEAAWDAIGKLPNYAKKVPFSSFFLLFFLLLSFPSSQLTHLTSFLFFHASSF